MPLNLLQNILKFKTFFAIFVNIAKIILLIFCVWICAKIISKYILIIFEALILIIFSVFYLIFFLLENASQIAQKGLNLIITQIITVFMTVTMMGISYNLLNLVSVGNSILGISSLMIALMLIEKTIENIDFIAIKSMFSIVFSINISAIISEEIPSILFPTDTKFNKLYEIPIIVTVIKTVIICVIIKFNPF